MGTFAAQSVYSNNPSPQTGAGLAALASNQEAIMELPGAQAPQSIEITDNALTFSTTPVSAYLVVDTEGQAAGDDLEVINPVVSATDNLHNGMVVYLQAADAARVVTVVNSNAANGIKTVGGSNVTLTTNTWLVLQLRSGTWHEIASSQPQNIDGVAFNGTAGITHAVTCSTAAATAAKTVTLTGFTLVSGAEITVKFTNGNTASNPTLNVSSTGAIPIVYQGVAIDNTAIDPNTVCRFYYDGTSWNVVGIVTIPATTASLGTSRLASASEIAAGAVASDTPTPVVVAAGDIFAGQALLKETAVRVAMQANGVTFLRDELPTPNKTTITIPANMRVIINDTLYTSTSSVTLDLSNLDTAANRAGKDAYIYACIPSSGTEPDFVLSMNSTVPSGYTATNSRKIGGFHCLCVDVGSITNHPLTGYVAGDILPASVWDLMHRPTCQPEGMVYIDKLDFWCDIYLQSGTGTSTKSVYGGTTTDTQPQGSHEEDMMWVGKSLLTSAEFTAAAEGSNQGTNIYGSADAVTTGGHRDTSNRRMISNYGCEDMCGFLWQWLADLSYGGSNSWGNDGGKGQTIYTNALLAGGHWYNGADCGSRSRTGYNSRLNATASLGGRGRAASRRNR